MWSVRTAGAIAAALLVAGCASDRSPAPSATYDLTPQMTPLEPAPVPDGPAVPRIEVKLAGADATLVRGRLATARRARDYAITVDQPSRLVAEKRLPPDEALKRTNGASSDAAFRLDYVFNTSGGTVTASLEASIVTNPGRPGEKVQPITMPAPDADALKSEISESA